MDLGTSTIEPLPGEIRREIDYSTAIPHDERINYSMVQRARQASTTTTSILDELGNSIIKDPHENRYTTTTTFCLRPSPGERIRPSDRIDRIHWIDWIDCAIIDAQ
jgi:Leucine-rich repeat (LRR) protein